MTVMEAGGEGKMNSPEYLYDKIGFAIEEMIIVRSDAGDGGWSLHHPDSTDADIADGSSPSLSSGTATRDPDTGEWDRPNAEDYRAAYVRWENL
jgi:hypothetical protein